MKEPLVSVIVVNWNGHGVIKDCLNSLIKIHYSNWELLVVDNGSSDKSLELLSSLHHSPPRAGFPISNFQLIKNKTNLGFAKANNQGYKMSKGKYILLLNNDTKVTVDFLGNLVDRMEGDHTIGVIQPKLFILGKKGYLDNVGSFLTRIGFMQHIGYMQKDTALFDNEMITFSAKGACMLIRSNIIKKVGLFDRDFESYFEETDFCWRVWLLGYKVLYFPKAFIYHRVGFSSKRQEQTFIFYHSLKNMQMAMLKNFSIQNVFLIGGTQLILISGLAFYYLLKLQFKKSLMILKAISWNIVNITETLKKRQVVQSFRKKTDDELFKFILKPVDFKNLFSHFAKVEANFK